MPTSTTFYRHLDTNYTPSDDEVPHIRAVIQENEEVLAEINAQIKALELARDAQVSLIQRHTALLSPIKRLPDDILSTLFLTLSSDAGNRDMEVSSRHPAVVVSHVCGRWRQLALDSPALWASLKIYMTIHSMDSEDDYWIRQTKWRHHMVCACLERSKDCDLFIELYFHEDPLLKGPHEQSIVGLVGALCDASSRWREATFKVTSTWSKIHSSESPFWQIFDLNGADVPRLEKLALSILHHPVHDADGRSFDWIQLFNQRSGLLSGCSLRSLSLGRMTGIIKPSLPVRWGALTSLQLDGFVEYGALRFVLNYDAALAILGLCGQLVTCNLAFFSSPNMPLSPRVQPRSVHLPNLKLLTLRRTVPGRDFLSSLNLPSLEHLFLLNASEIAAAGNLVEAWIQAYGPQLKELHINVSNLTMPGVASCMDCLPNIAVLHLDENQRRVSREAASLDGDFLKRLAPPCEEEDGNARDVVLWLPKLEVISFPRRATLITRQNLRMFMERRRKLCEKTDTSIAKLRKIISPHGTFIAGDNGIIVVDED
ncbi:hypothetical protein D9611_005421 [Ephemerocybe angulata]|uniref:F-box domain-containing protein n=1 Tax=Ephemerocybe angulata TaxID=980116 RepID=A0A8H5FDF9_9AGAR|nr:hypothetical protein D9611_005421 [Tulosesus angulatus]